MQQITDWGAATITGVAAGIAALMASLPSLLGALILLIIGWAIAGWVGGLVAKLGRSVRLDDMTERAGVNGFLRSSGTTMRASQLLGALVTWVVRLVFIEMAADRLGLPQVTAVINQVLGFIPNIVVAAIVLIAGAFVAKILSGVVRGSASEAGIGNADLLSRLTSGVVIAFAVIIALNELNVAPVVINTLYIGLVAALALALGLAFGLGGRETAAKYWQQWSSGIETTAARVSGNVQTRTSVYGDTTAPAALNDTPASTPIRRS